MLRRTVVLLIALAAFINLTGCHLYPEKRPPTLDSTTSAEQFERLYWKAVTSSDWKQVAALQAPNVLFTTRNGDHVTGEQWINWLKQTPPAEYLIGAVQLRPQGADRVVSYDVSLTQKNSHTPIDLAVVSVWQQVGDNLIMVAHSETPRTATAK
jgi:Domain of unknown function (DUF4440)